MRGLVIERLELRAAEAIDIHPVEQPGLPRVVHDRQGDVMVRGVILQLFGGLESVLDQLVGPRVIQGVPLHYYFGRPKLHRTPPYMLSLFGMYRLRILSIASVRSFHSCAVRSDFNLNRNPRILVALAIRSLFCSSRIFMNCSGVAS